MPAHIAILRVAIRQSCFAHPICSMLVSLDKILLKIIYGVIDETIVYRVIAGVVFKLVEC
jgi:hypothetical protein